MSTESESKAAKRNGDGDEGQRSTALEPEENLEDEEEAEEEEAEAEEPEEEEEEEEPEEEEEEEEPEEEEEEEPAKPATLAKAGGKPLPRPPKAASKKSGAKKRPARPGKKKGSPTRHIVFFVLLVVGLAGAFAVLGNQGGGGMPDSRPTWKTGQEVFVEITLVHTDQRNLACAMEGEINGRYCAFVSGNQRNEKPSDSAATDKVLQPYTTTDQKQFLGAGLWVQETMKKNLPRTRFSVKCKLAVEGQAKAAQVQWKPGEGWHPGDRWFTGVLKDCSKPVEQQ